MDTESLNLVFVLAYLVVGTVGVALLMNWALKRFDFSRPTQSPSRQASQRSSRRVTQK